VGSVESHKALRLVRQSEIGIDRLTQGTVGKRKPDSNEVLERQHFSTNVAEVLRKCRGAFFRCVMGRLSCFLRFLQGVEELTVLSPVRSESAIAPAQGQNLLCGRIVRLGAGLVKVERLSKVRLKNRRGAVLQVRRVRRPGGAFLPGGTL
jgi:hypothetical protein